MAIIELTHRLQKAVLWAAAGVDNFGDTKVSSPVEVYVRWVETESESGDAKSNPTASTIQATVDRDIAVGSIMRLGALADLPASPGSLMQVSSCTRTPDIKNRNIHRTVNLVYYSEELPTIV